MIEKTLFLTLSIKIIIYTLYANIYLCVCAWHVMKTISVQIL
jgi:hypothetical protein